MADATETFVSWWFGYDHRNQMIWAEERYYFIEAFTGGGEESEESAAAMELGGEGGFEESQMGFPNYGGTLYMRAEYEYDWYGNRIEKRVDTDGDEDWDLIQRYALDGWNPAKRGGTGNERFDVWADLDGESSLTTRYLHGDDVDQLFARIEDDGAAAWMLTGRLGSVVGATDGGGVLRVTMAYDGFGNMSSTSLTGNPLPVGRYTWTGREWDTETTFQYNRARYYYPRIGKWTSEDPIGINAGDSNLYRYVHNRYQNATDPSGLQEWPGTSMSPATFTLAALEQFQAGKGTPAQKLPDDSYLTIINNVEGGWKARIIYTNEVVSFPVYKTTKLSKEEVNKQLEGVAKRQEQIAAAKGKTFMDLTDLLVTLPAAWPDLMVVEGDGSGSLLSFERLDFKTAKVPVNVYPWSMQTSDQYIFKYHSDTITNKKGSWWLTTGRMIPFWGAAVTVDDGLNAWKKGNYAQGLGLMAFGTGQMALDLSLAYGGAVAGGRTLGLAGGAGSKGSGTFFRNATVGVASSDDSARMLGIAHRWADRIGVNSAEIHAVRDLGGSATGGTMGGRIFLDPRAFRQAFDARLGRVVSPMENLTRTILHEHAHVLQSVSRTELYWSGSAATRELLERVAYRFENVFYVVLQRRLGGA